MRRRSLKKLHAVLEYFMTEYYSLFSISQPSDMVFSDICKRYYVWDDCIVNDVNLSDHDPICLSLSLPLVHPVLLSAKSAPLSRPQVNWHKASTNDSKFSVGCA